jgi:hypothetical protein
MRRQQGILKDAGAIESPGQRKDFLTEQLALAKKNVEGIDLQIASLQKAMTKQFGTENSIGRAMLSAIGNKELELAQTQLDEAKAAADQARDFVGQLEDAIKDIDRFKGAKATAPEAPKLPGMDSQMMQEGRRVLEQFMTPMERYKQQVADLNRLYSAGALGALDSEQATRVYTDALKAATDELEKARKGEAALEMERRAAEILEQNLTPAQQLSKVEAELGELVRRRLLTVQQANRELDRQRKLLMPIADQQRAINEAAGGGAIGHEGIERGSIEEFVFIANARRRANEEEQVARQLAEQQAAQPQQEIARVEDKPAAREGDAPHWATQSQQMSELIAEVRALKTHQERARQPFLAPANVG